MKANPERGEVSLVVSREGSVVEYVLFLGMAASRALETRRTENAPQLIEKALGGDFTALSDVIWLLLQKHHAKEFETAESVDSLIDECGGPMRAQKLIRAVLELQTEDGYARNPQKAPKPERTGERSTSKPAA